MSKPDGYAEASSDADFCRRKGWAAGTRLVGDEGYGPTVIEITAIGEKNILAKMISQNGEPARGYENLWTLSCRPWVALARSTQDEGESHVS